MATIESEASVSEQYRFIVNSDDLLRAICAVYARYGRDGRKPGAERWVEPCQSQRMTAAEVRTEWERIYCKRTGRRNAPHIFPFSEELITHWWTKLRKKRNKLDVIAAYGIPIISPSMLDERDDEDEDDE